jgi:hypothetical protein
VPSPQEKFFNKHVFIHTHVEKCGGSTLVRHLRALLGDQHVFDARFSSPIKSKKNTRYNLKNRVPLANIRALSGHLPYNTRLAKIFPNTKWTSYFFPLEILPCFRKKPLYIASVRHPIEQLQSFFRYLKTRPHHPIYNDGIKNNDFDEFIQILVLKKSSKINNGICSQITGVKNSSSILEEAKNSFNHNYLAIVPYNKTHELANVVAEALQLPHVENCIVNASTPGETIIPSKKTLMDLEEKCRYDIQFYDYVLNGYQEKLKNSKEKLHHLLYL